MLSGTDCLLCEPSVVGAKSTGKNGVGKAGAGKREPRRVWVCGLFVVDRFRDRHLDSLLATSSDRSITRIKLPESTLWIAASS